VLTRLRDGAVLSAVKLSTPASKSIGWLIVHPSEPVLAYPELLPQVLIEEGCRREDDDSQVMGDRFGSTEQGLPS
jgi:hypothetical protein